MLNVFRANLLHHRVEIPVAAGEIGSVESHFVCPLHLGSLTLH